MSMCGMCLHTEIVYSICVLLQMCVLIWVRTSIYCICLLILKNHERNYSDCKMKTQSGSLLSIDP